MAGDPKPMGRAQVRNLFTPGIYRKGFEDDPVAEEALLDAAWEGYQVGGMKAAKRAFDRAADGYMIARKR